MSERRPGWTRALTAGALLGLVGIVGALVVAPAAFGPPDIDRVEIRDRAPLADRTAWHQEWRRRASRWEDVPDPPGTGPILRARYWISHGSYNMEVRRRGDRIVVALGGVDQQVGGGGWTAFGEGVVRGGRPTQGGAFRGVEAEITWSCLGVRYRYASDGVGYLTFSDDGRELTAWYMAYEDPAYWARAHGVQHESADEAAPTWGTLKGQIALSTSNRAPFVLSKPTTITVCAVGPDGAALADMVVQVKGNDATRTRTDARGCATLPLGPEDFPVGPVIAAGGYGYRNGEVVLPRSQLAGTDNPILTVSLARMHTQDDPSYVWQRATPGHDPDDAMACGTCHEWQYQEWVGSRHALANDNGHVKWTSLQLRAHSTVQRCDGCHRPAFAAYPNGAPFARSSPLSAVHCDFCHKVDRVTDVRQSGMHGAMEVVRPSPTSRERPGGIHQVFGARADTTFAYMGVVQNPLLEASHFCAACHQGGGTWTEGSVPKVNTFEEWRVWAAKRPNESFRSCQDCHMPGGTTVRESGDRMAQLAWDGAHRTPMAVHSHRFEGTEPTFAANALGVTLTKEVKGNQVHVSLTLTNTGAGHKLPTGSWSKHVVVGVWARDGDVPLRLVEGSRAILTAASSPDALAAGDWRNPAGLILGVRPRDADPTTPFSTPHLARTWTAAQLHDTRLDPGLPRTAAFVFARQGALTTTPMVEVRVVHRRGAFGATTDTVPWTLGRYDPAPQVQWKRVVR